MQGYHPESAAARGDTRASFATHGPGPWHCRIPDSKKPSRNMACTDCPAASRGMREARAGRTPGNNLSACSYSRSDKHPSVSSVPRDEMKRGAGVSPAALTISKFECSSKRESARGCQPERSQAGPPTTLGVTSDDPSSRGNVRHAATTFRPACADADSPIRDNPR